MHAWYSFPLSLQKPFSESLSDPEFVITDFAKFNRPAQLHLAWQALDRFVQSEGRVPRPYNTEDSARFLELATALNEEAEGAGKVRTFHHPSLKHVMCIANYKLQKERLHTIQNKVFNSLSGLEKYMYIL